MHVLASRDQHGHRHASRGSLSFVAGTYFTSTIVRRVMSYTNGSAVFSVSPYKYKLEQIIFIILKISTESVTTEVGNLNHAGQFAIYE